MPQSANPHFVGLDIGTSTVRCVVGMLDTSAGNKPSIIGHGSAPNQGMRKGVVVHVDDVAEAIVQAITEAERISGYRITQATVNVNGAHVSGINSKGVIAISSANREITGEDRYRVEEAATVVQLPPNREIIQFFAKNYSVDGQQNIKDPVGMSGVRLEVDAHIVTASTPSLRNLDFALSKAQVAPQHHTVSSLAATEAVMSRQQKEAGTVLLDIGAGTTNLIVLEDGEVQHVAVLPIGGMHITNDLAIGLKTDLDVAEQVKLQHATLGKATKTTANVNIGKTTHSFPMDDVQMIVEARVEELLEFVDKELARIKRSRKLPGGVIITGGTAKLPGMAEFAKEHLQLSARIGKLNEEIGGLVDTVEGTDYATVIGLMLLDMLLLPEEPAAAQGAAGKATAGAMGMVQGLLKRLKT
ncbi:MAG TPA: cell division protein FtsA [Candidatus Saccharimonadales bacterium]|nr:cell division protein FtsA [Candidatus Saccharimonadales bacterium]